MSANGDNEQMAITTGPVNAGCTKRLCQSSSCVAALRAKHHCYLWYNAAGITVWPFGATHARYKESSKEVTPGPSNRLG
jgi:hypothetical protein